MVLVGPSHPCMGRVGLQWQIMGQEGGLRAAGAKRNGSRGNEVNREEMKRRVFWYSRSRCGTHAGDFQKVVVSAVECLMQCLTRDRI
jgi:uncharacterized protein YcfJ